MADKLSLKQSQVDEEKKRIIIVELDEISNIGMLVDTVTEMIRIHADKITDAPEIARAVHTDYIQELLKSINSY